MCGVNCIEGNPSDPTTHFLMAAGLRQNESASLKITKYLFGRVQQCASKKNEQDMQVMVVHVPIIL